MLITIIDLYTFDHLTPKFSVNQIQQYIISDWLFVHHVINFNKSGFIISVKSSCTMRLTSFSLHDLPTPLYINIRHQIEDIFKLRMSTTKKQEFFKLFRIIAPPGVDLGGEGQFKALSSSFTLRYIDTWL